MRDPPTKAAGDYRWEPGPAANDLRSSPQIKNRECVAPGRGKRQETQEQPLGGWIIYQGITGTPGNSGGKTKRNHKSPKRLRLKKKETGNDV